MMRSTEASPHKRLKPVALVSPSWRINPQAPLALSIAAAPLTVAGGVTNGVGTVVDGTVAGILPGAVAPASQGPLIGAGLLPANRDDIERLKSLTGRQFDALYRSTQQDALRQLATLYRDYATSGDDPALRSLASSELPKVNRRLEEIARF